MNEFEFIVAKNPIEVLLNTFLNPEKKYEIMLSFTEQTDIINLNKIFKRHKNIEKLTIQSENKNISAKELILPKRTFKYINTLEIYIPVKKTVNADFSNQNTDTLQITGNTGLIFKKIGLNQTKIRNIKLTNVYSEKIIDISGISPEKIILEKCSKCRLPKNLTGIFQLKVKDTFLTNRTLYITNTQKQCKIEGIKPKLYIKNKNSKTKTVITKCNKICFENELTVKKITVAECANVKINKIKNASFIEFHKNKNYELPGNKLFIENEFSDFLNIKGMFPFSVDISLKKNTGLIFDNVFIKRINISGIYNFVKIIDKFILSEPFIFKNPEKTEIYINPKIPVENAFKNVSFLFSHEKTRFKLSIFSDYLLYKNYSLPIKIINNSPNDLKIGNNKNIGVKIKGKFVFLNILKQHKHFSAEDFDFFKKLNPEEILNIIKYKKYSADKFPYLLEIFYQAFV